jgi:hypothetical protein
MSSQSTEAASSKPSVLYRNLQPLSSQSHGAWRLKEADLAFAQDAYLAPVLASEFSQASRSYPVVFAGDAAQPIAVLGIERRNLFVSEGRWQPDTYVPAFVRRYPFAFMAVEQPAGYVLAIDADSDAVVKSAGDGRALFENGEPTQMTRDALRFCELFQSEAKGTLAFVEALKARDLLVSRHADITLPTGRKLGLDGFRIVDAERFAKLDDATVVEWHRVGWLQLVHFHLASLDRFAALLARAARLPATGADIATAAN